MAVPNDMSVESVNIELREGGLGKKRMGTESVAITTVVTGGIYDAAKFVPGNDPTVAEFWFTGADVGSQQKFYRVPGNAASATSPTPVSNISRPSSKAQLNGKFFIACPNDVAGTFQNRLLVYAPNESTTAVRFAGLAPEGAPTVANTGVGTYAATPRIYRVITKRIVSGVVVSQSNPSAETAFTPSGGGTAARVTKAANSGEGETHWCVEASGTGAGDVFWQISGDIVIATTTYDDSVNPQDYPINGLVPPPFGSNYPFPSVKYLITDGVRLLGLGINATAQQTSVPPVSGRLYFTPAIGSSDMGDDERIVDTADTSGWIDLAIGGGGVDRGLGLINNNVVAFQSNGVFVFNPTGNADIPFRRSNVFKRVGSIAGSTIVSAEDEVGQAALYFLDPINGPYRIGNSESIIQWLGKDVKDLWNTVDLDSTSPELDFWGVYDSARKLVIWKVKRTTAAGGGSFLLVFDVTNGKLVDGDEVRYGWVQWTDIAGLSTSSAVMFASALTSPRPVAESLYIGAPSTGVAGALAYRALSTATQDGSTSYQGYIRSCAYRWNPLGRLKKLLFFIVFTKARAATTIRTRFIANWGQQTLDQTVSIAAVGSSEYVLPRPNPVDFTELQTLQYELGDSAAVNNTWELDGAEGELTTLDEQRTP